VPHRIGARRTGPLAGGPLDLSPRRTDAALALCASERRRPAARSHGRPADAPAATDPPRTGRTFAALGHAMGLCRDAELDGPGGHRLPGPSDPRRARSHDPAVAP